MLAALLLLAASPPDRSLVELESATYQIAAHDYRYVYARIANWPATVICRINVASGAPIGAQLVTNEDLTNFIRGRPNGYLVSLDARRAGEFQQPVPEKGEYAIVLKNDSPEPSMVRVEAAVQFAREPDVAKYLPPARRLTIVLISMFAFFAIVSFSAWKLIGAIRRT